MLFKDKHVVITGGAGGIGNLLTRAFTEQGALVTIVDRVDTIEPSENVILSQGDLSDLEGIRKVADVLASQQVDILVNLAGLQYFGLFEEQSPEHMMLLYTVNLIAPAILARAVLPSMKARGQGQIVNIGSTFGSINFAHFVTYSSSKAGLKGLSEALRREVKDSGIDVTHISPRAVKTPLNSDKVMQLAKIVKMNMDAPEYVVAKIIQAISKKKKDVYIGFPESLFVRINAILPRVVDVALAADNKKAKTLLNQIEMV